MSVDLNEAFLAKIAGWEAMKIARHLVASGKVLSSNYTAPLLKGVVQDGTTSYRAGLVLKSGIDLENICSCRASRDWGTICAHSVAVGLHLLNPPKAGESSRETPNVQSPSAAAPVPIDAPRRLRRAIAGEPAAEQLDLFIILPPNFVEAAARGKVMLVCEAQRAASASTAEGRQRNAITPRRVPLNTLPRQQPFHVGAEDERVLARLEEIAGEPPGMIVLTTREFAELLPALVAHPRVTLGRTDAVRVAREPWMPRLLATLETNGEIVLQRSERGEVPVVLENWVFHDRTFQPVGLPTTFAGALRAPIRLTRPQVPEFLNDERVKLTSAGMSASSSAEENPGAEASASTVALIDANFCVEDFAVATQPPKFLLNLSGGLAQLSAQLQCRYPGRVLTLGATNHNDSPWMPDPNDVKRYALRDFAAEERATARLLRSGFAGPDAQGRWQLNGQERVLNFFAREYSHLQKEWEVTLEERLQRSTQEKIERIEPRFQITPSGVQWFDFGVSFESSGGEKFSAAEIQRLVLSGLSHTRLRNGRMAVIDTGAVEELQQFLLDASPQQHSGGYRISNAQAGFLESTLREQGWQAQAPPAWRNRARQQSGEARLECPPLGDLEKVLRPYQKQGVAWLHFLRSNGFGGILADEMGLGKTLQTLAFLQSRPGFQPSHEPEGGATLSPARRGETLALPGRVSDSRRGEDTAALPARTVHGPNVRPISEVEASHEPQGSAGFQPASAPAPEPPGGALYVRAGQVPGPNDLVRGGKSAGNIQGEQEVRPTLVICPTSLVFNWVAEAAKFTPALKVLALHGPQRHGLFARIPESDLVVTSYALIRRDFDRYKEFEFDTVVLDEAQHIKNRQTQNAQAVKALRSAHRLVLTGTPLENSVLDLWSIFDFLMPSYLGAAQDFRERYEAPIAREKDSEAQARLARRLRPFMLRRLKRDVAADLPAKIDQVSFCELNDEQRAVYQQVMEFSRKEVIESVGAQGLARARMVVLTALLRLRQICCDLRLLKSPGTEGPFPPLHEPEGRATPSSARRSEVLGLSRRPSDSRRGEDTAALPARTVPGPDAGDESLQDSGKVEAFDELLQEIIDGGHRALVFSQFVSMLTLLKERLHEQGVEFCYLDGSTTDRREVVEKFQTTFVPVFLISLKAGGVGLNLTGADTVIHFDPWWNPAVEDQATDRAHRIGQTRIVTSYKLITRGTVEEKILTLQQKKREVITATLGGEEALVQSLTWEEIQELLS